MKRHTPSGQCNELSEISPETEDGFTPAQWEAPHIVELDFRETRSGGAANSDGTGYS